MELIEDIGPILGIVAFLGFAVLALLIVLQAREVRRLREWAGRAPERAGEADEATQAVLDARAEGSEEAEGALTKARSRLGSTFGPAWDAVDRNSPVDPRWLVGALAVGLIAALVLTSGFGLIGGDDPATESPRGGERRAGGENKEPKEDQVEVAIFNATQIDDPVAPVSAVPGLADAAATQLVRPAGFEVVAKTDSPGGEDDSIIMVEAGSEDAAAELASALEPDLGTTEVIPMTPEIANLSEDAPIALLVGLDDAEFAADATTAP